MPYIKPSERVVLAPLVVTLAGAIADLDAGGFQPGRSDGRVNYAITKLIHLLYGKSGPYYSFNAAVGALQLAQDEYKRRYVYLYEDKKREENGDV